MLKSIMKNRFRFSVPPKFFFIMLLKLEVMRTRRQHDKSCCFQAQSHWFASMTLCKRCKKRAKRPNLAEVSFQHSFPDSLYVLAMVLHAVGAEGIDSVSALVKSDRSNRNIHQGVIRWKTRKTFPHRQIEGTEVFIIFILEGRQ